MRNLAKSFVKRCADLMGVAILRKNDDLRLKLYQVAFSSDILAKKPFINIGAGSFWHPYWTNVDYVSDWYSSVQRDVVHYDIMSKEPLPFDDQSIKIAYTSHTIEHVKDECVAKLFGEVFRVLEPGGIFRITTGPDAETDYRALMAGDASWFYWDEAYASPDEYERIYHKSPLTTPLAERWLHHFASCLAPNDTSPSPKKYSTDEIMSIVQSRSMEDALNFFAAQCPFDYRRPGNHVSWWTHQKTMDFVQQAGFATVYRSGYQQSASPFLRRSNLFDTTHPQMSLYVEAIK